MTSGIYIIRNIESGKVYIGSAVKLNKRKSDHFSELQSGKHHNQHLQNAYNKYGVDAFEFAVLVRCKKDELVHGINYEQQAIDLYRRKLGWEMLYNIAPKADEFI